MSTDVISIPNIRIIETPAFIYIEKAISDSLELLEQARIKTGFKLLFSVKALSIAGAIRFISSRVDGFSTSSIFEAKLARSFAKPDTTIHLSTPSIRGSQIRDISDLCNYVSFNSLSHWRLYSSELSNSKIGLGIRINPELSFIPDDRYNPCRKYSKLGVPIQELLIEFKHSGKPLDGVQGLHFHTNCESEDFNDLFMTIQHIRKRLPWMLDRIKWMNIGGGYLIDTSTDLHKLVDAIGLVKTESGIDVFFEPGKTISGKAGFIVSSVIDIFNHGSKIIAILDTSVNHMPEVFEYGFKPCISQESMNGKYSYILAGATCLAGDLFGEYQFDEPLDIGSRLVFEDMGAYTLVKANMFNGINLPTIYAYTLDGKLEIKRQFTYDDFLSRCGSR